MTKDQLNSAFDSFLSENNGKFIERVDSSALNQCFDLAIYFIEKLGLPKTVFSGLYGAHEIYDNWSSPLFEKIPNTAEYVPQKGDIVVWDGDLNGGIGHVSVATGKGDTNGFESFDQNWKAGSPATLVQHDYDFVLGVQRFLVTQSTMVTDKQIKESGILEQLLNLLVDAGKLSSRAIEDYLDNENFQGAIKNLIKDDADQTEAATVAQKEIEVLKNEVTQVQDKADIDLQKAVADVKDKCQVDQVSALEDKNKLIKELQDAIAKGVMKEKVPVETPLADRFKGKRIRDKILAILSILEA